MLDGRSNLHDSDVWEGHVGASEIALTGVSGKCTQITAMPTSWVLCKQSLKEGKVFRASGFCIAVDASLEVDNRLSNHVDST